EMTADMAASLTGYNWAGEYLASLYQARYFTERVQKEKSWYRYHSLFREFLLAMAERRYPPEELARLRRHGAQIFFDTRHMEAGIALLRAAKDWDGVAAHALALAPELIRQGRLQTVGVWLKEVL